VPWAAVPRRQAAAPAAEGRRLRRVIERLGNPPGRAGARPSPAPGPAAAGRTGAGSGLRATRCRRPARARRPCPAVPADRVPRSAAGVGCTTLPASSKSPSSTRSITASSADPGSGLCRRNPGLARVAGDPLVGVFGILGLAEHDPWALPLGRIGEEQAAGLQPVLVVADLRMFTKRPLAAPALLVNTTCAWIARAAS